MESHRGGVTNSSASAYPCFLPFAGVVSPRFSSSLQPSIAVVVFVQEGTSMPPAAPPEQSASSTLFVVTSPTPFPPTATTPAVLRCRVNRDALVPILALLHRVAEKRSPVPILTHVCVASHVSGDLEFRATDLELGLRCRCPATVTSAGSCTVE